MSYFVSAYETTIGSKYVMDNVRNSIEKAIVVHDLSYDNCTGVGIKPSNEIYPLGITNANGKFDEVPVFAHPLLVTHGKDRYLCSDYRHVLDSENKVKNIVEFNFTRLKTILALKWYSDKNRLRTDLSFVASIFAAWISDTVSKRYMLDPRDQLLLMIISDYYFQSQFLAEPPSEDDKQKFAIHTMKVFKAPSNLIFEAYDKMGPLLNINQFCEDMVKVLDNPRLQGFNSGALITILANTWYGYNAKENIAVALEYPPVMTSLVYTALVEKSYRNSILAKITERYSKNGAGNQFLEVLEVMLEDSTIGDYSQC